MNLAEPFQLKHTNVSHPQLRHSESKISNTASEHYFSAGSDASSNGSDAPHTFDPSTRRYSTPPSRVRSPYENSDRIGSLNNVGAGAGPSGRYSPEKLRSPVEPKSVHFNHDKALRRKPVPSSSSGSGSHEGRPGSSPAVFHDAQNSASTSEPPMDRDLAPTPGVDDTPYIRFAIDQLTRDEEVRGSRHYRGGSLSSHPVRAADIQQEPPFLVNERHLSEVSEKPDIPPRHPRRSSVTSPVGDDEEGRIRDVFEPYDPPHKSFIYPRLRFVPSILRPFALSVFIILNILMLAALIFSSVWSLTHQGLWQYKNFGDTRYFVFEYLYAICGGLLFLWLINIELAIYRVAPFIALASTSSRSRASAMFLEIVPTNFLFPSFQHLRAGLPVIGVFMFAAWLQIFTVPLLASAFDVAHVSEATFGSPWRWVAVQAVIWAAVGLYAILILSLFVLMIYLRRTPTGLRWDPRSLADYICLLERSNTLSDFTDAEILNHVSELRHVLRHRSDRLGYWHTTARPNFIFYGLGEAGAPPRSYVVEQGQIREKIANRQSGGPRDSGYEDVEPLAFNTGRSAGRQLRYSNTSVPSRNENIHAPHLRHRHMPWFLSPASTILWAFVATILLAAFFVASFINRAVLTGFMPAVPVAADNKGFSATNFLYSFVPSFIGMLCVLVFLPMDLTVRRLIPFAELSNVNGAGAERSLLLEYPSAPFGLITLQAALNRHWRVAILSLLSLLSMALPILGGGVFWAQFYQNPPQLRVAAHPNGFYALCAFVAVYGLGWWFTIVSRARYGLPHESNCLAEYFSWVYQSGIVTDAAFSGIQTKTELVTRLLSVPAGERRVSVEPSPAGDSPEGIHVQDENDERRLSYPRRMSVLSPLPPPPNGVMLGGGASQSVLSLVGGDVGRIQARNPEIQPARLREEVRVPRYAFGIYKGRDGREHIGIDRLMRPGGVEMVVLGRDAPKNRQLGQGEAGGSRWSFSQSERGSTTWLSRLRGR